MTTRPIRLAIIGSGGITHAHGVGILKHSDKIQCVALCDVSQENLKKRNEQLGGNCHIYTDWKQMFSEMGSEIDAVDIALPHHLHAPAILDACEAKKHILCEKPMCMNRDEAAQIDRAVKASGITYVSAHNQLFIPSIQRARKMIDEGAVGRVQWIRSQDCFRAGDGDGFKGSWRCDLKTQGGGVLIDTGYHPTYRLLYLANSKPLSVRGTMGRFLQKYLEGEDTASVQVCFENGVIGEIFTSWAMELPHGSAMFHVIGSEGQIFGDYTSLSYIKRGWQQPMKINFPDAHTFVDQMEYFADVLQGKRPVLHGVEEGFAVLDLILKASETAQGWEHCAQAGNRASLK